MKNKIIKIEGKLKVTDIVTVNGINEDYLLQIAATAEKKSEHPLGESIVKEAEKKHLELKKSAGFIAIPGRGIEIVIDDNIVLVGNKKFMNENYISLEKPEKIADKLIEEGKTPIFISIDYRLSGIIAVADTVKLKGFKPLI